MTTLLNIVISNDSKDVPKNLRHLIRIIMIKINIKTKISSDNSTPSFLRPAELF